MLFIHMAGNHAYPLVALFEQMRSHLVASGMVVQRNATHVQIVVGAVEKHHRYIVMYQLLDSCL